MQAGCPRAMRRPGFDRPEYGAATNRIATADRGVDRLIGGAKAAMGHHHDAAVDHTAGKDDDAGTRSVNDLARRRREVHPTVAGQPLLRRRVKAPQHRGNRLQRPLPPGQRGAWRGGDRLHAAHLKPAKQHRQGNGQRHRPGPKARSWH